MMIATLILLAITIASAVFCYKIADDKGFNKILWAALGVIFGPFALLAVYLLKKKAPEAEAPAAAEAEPAK